MMKKTVSLVVILALLLTMAPGAAYAAEPAAITLNELSNATAGSMVTISGTTTLAEVGIKVIHPNKTIVFMDAVKASGGVFSASFRMPSDAAAGSYTVVAGQGSTAAAATLSITNLPPVQLGTPAKPSLANGIATWTAVTNENNGYSLQLYKNNSPAGSAVLVTHGAPLSYDFSTAMTEDGSYTVTVTALGSGGYCDSKESEKSEAQVVGAHGIAVTGISLNAVGINVVVGNSQALTAAVIPASATNQAVTWSSSNAAVATVNSSGMVTAVAVGTVAITVTTVDGGYTASCTVTVTAGGGNNSNNNSTGDDSRDNSNDTSAASAKTYQAVVSGNGSQAATLPVNVNTSAGGAAVELGSLSGNIFTGGGTSIISVPPIPGIDNYSLGIPVAYLSTPNGAGTLTFTTDKGSMTLPACMLEGIAGAEGKKAEITIGRGDKSGLNDEVKAAIGSRPIVQIYLRLDGVQTEWNNPNAPVTVSIPYTPAAEELRNPESIIIWYIDGSGNAVCVPNGHYDTATRTVTFTTTHFSYYAVGYNKATFKDVAANMWYSKAVGFIAARKITTGTGNGNYNPGAKLTRGEFLVMMMRAYGIKPDKDLKNNFTDAGNTYYTGYLAAAKRLGISGGTGNNMFAPDKEITRQEMFTLLYNALKVIGELPEGNSGKQLSAFSDAGQIASWAKDAMMLFVETGTISGNDGKLSMPGTATRAEMAQVLYNLLAK